MEHDTNLQCPYCSSSVPTNESWMQKNKRVMCHTCCKSFDVESHGEVDSGDPGDWG